MENNYQEETEINNRGYVIGKVASKPVKTHEIEGESFYDFLVEVKRLSEQTDTIPVSISDRLIMTNKMNLELNEEVALKGEFRSCNRIEENRSKLMLYFFAKDKLCEEEREKLGLNVANANKLNLTGYICKPTVFRTTPFNREICDVLLAVNRPNFNKSDYIPCIVWGRGARFMQIMPVGTKINIEGRIQSRQYNKILENGREEKRTAYEVSCSNFSILEQEKHNQVEEEAENF